MKKRYKWEYVWMPVDKDTGEAYPCWAEYSRDACRQRIREEYGDCFKAVKFIPCTHPYIQRLIHGEGD